MEEMKSKVYVLADAQGRITCCEGGYTIGNIQNIEEWALIDEGTGDKYNLCQSHYFPGGLFTVDGIPLYKLDWDANPVERTAEEIAADRAARPEPVAEPTADDLINILLGVSE